MIIWYYLFIIFFYRAHFNYDQPNKGEMSFRKGDVFHVVDTLHNGVVGSWQVFRIGMLIHCITSTVVLILTSFKNYNLHTLFTSHFRILFDLCHPPNMKPKLNYNALVMSMILYFLLPLSSWLIKFWTICLKKVGVVQLSQ